MRKLFETEEDFNEYLKVLRSKDSTEIQSYYKQFDHGKEELLRRLSAHLLMPYGIVNEDRIKEIFKTKEING